MAVRGGTTTSRGSATVRGSLGSRGSATTSRGSAAGRGSRRSATVRGGRGSRGGRGASVSSGAQKRAPPVDGIILPGNVRAYVPTSTVWEETESTSAQNTTAQESVVHYSLEDAQSTLFDDSLLLDPLPGTQLPAYDSDEPMRTEYTDCPSPAPPGDTTCTHGMRGV